MKETRYAVLIGMSNYKHNPLPYSTKDAEDVRDVLVQYCKFSKENIFVIRDSIKPVLTQIKEAFDSIQVKFIAGSDLLLFYYSGHGEYDQEEEKSLLNFEDDSSLGIGDIVVNYFQPLRAKNNYLIVDACHSGKNVYIRPKYSARKMERKFLNDSKELYFLFAAEENRKAFQDDSLKNSYYTYYFVDAIRNEKLYDDDGWLTMSSIDDYIRKKLSRVTDVVQIPGSESRSTGFKPFAFRNVKYCKSNQESTIIKKEIMSNNFTDSFDLEQSITIENRSRIQEKLRGLLVTEVDSFNLESLESEYEVVSKSKNPSISFEIEQELDKAIITKARKKDLEAINDLFSVQLLKQNRRRTGLTAMFDMIHGEPEPEYSYNISYDENFIVSAFIELKARSIQNASGGLYCILYQAKYGFVFCKAFFRYVWAGTHEKISNFVNVELTPYRLVDTNIDEAKSELALSLNTLIDNIKEWSIERKKEIATFLNNAK